MQHEITPSDQGSLAARVDSACTPPGGKRAESLHCGQGIAFVILLRATVSVGVLSRLLGCSQESVIIFSGGGSAWPFLPSSPTTHTLPQCWPSLWPGFVLQVRCDFCRVLPELGQVFVFESCPTSAKYGPDLTEFGPAPTVLRNRHLCVCDFGQGGGHRFRRNHWRPKAGTTAWRVRGRWGAHPRVNIA